MHKRFGLPTAIAMVVGTVIGSGVFFKAQNVLDSNDGNMLRSILTVLTVGMIMLVCAYCFSLLASRVEKVNGIVDYSELALGADYAYYVGWFFTTIFYPTLTACLSWISALYTLTLFGVNDEALGGAVPLWVVNLLLALFYLLMLFAVNVLSPKLSAKFQVSTTFIKLVPLVVMAIVGTVAGLISGTFADNAVISSGDAGSHSGGGFFGAVVSFAFAFEGWIFATTINSELKDAKKNLPRALFFGALIIIAVYVGYFLGIFGTLHSGEIIASENLPKDAFSKLFGSPVFGTVAYVFVVISCLGTTNGLMLASCRGIYSIAVRDQGPMAEKFSHVNSRFDMPIRSSVFGLALSIVWLLQWQLGYINGSLPDLISFENDELPIITFYAACIPIFIYIMVKCTDLNPAKRFVFPSLATLACLFMVFSAVYKYRLDALYYLIVFTVIMLIGVLFHRKDGKTLIGRLIAKIKSTTKKEK